MTKHMPEKVSVAVKSAIENPERRKAIKRIFRHAGVAVFGTMVAQAAISQGLPVLPKFSGRLARCRKKSLILPASAAVYVSKIAPTIFSSWPLGLIRRHWVPHSL